MVDLTSRIIGVESGGNPYATNPNSSAGGAGQFIDSTWLAMIQKYRPDLLNGRTREQVLQLKFIPQLAKEMTFNYARENQDYLSSKGIPVNDTSSYLAHFAGPQGAVGLYSNPDASAESILGPRVVNANPFLRGKSGQDVINWAEDKMSPGQRMMANSLRKYGASKEAIGSEAPQGGAIAKLLPAMAPKPKYEDQSSRLARADAATKAGQEYAKKAGSWWEVAASLANAGVGAYLKDKAIKGEQANNDGFITAIKAATTPREQAEVFLAYPQTMEYGAKMLTTIGAKPAEEWVPTADGQYLVEKHTGKTKPTGYVKEEKSPAAVQEYEYAKKQGFPGTFQEYEIEKAKAKASSVTVNAGEKESEKQMAKKFAEDYDKIDKAATSARDNLANLDLAQSAIEEGVRTGFGAEFEQKLRKVGVAMGLGNVDKVAAGELLDTVTSRLTLQMRNPDSGMGMPGAMSDADREFLKTSQIGLDKTPEGNAAMLRAARALENRKLELARMADNYITENGAIDVGFKRKVKEYVDSHPLFAVDKKQPTEAPPGGFKILGVR